MPPFASIRSLDGLRLLDSVASRYGTRPSALAGIDDAYLAYCIDEAAALAGLDAERRAWDEARNRTPEPQGSTPRPATGATLTMTDRGPMLRGKVPILWPDRANAPE